MRAVERAFLNECSKSQLKETKVVATQIVAYTGTIETLLSLRVKMFPIDLISIQKEQSKIIESTRT